VHPRRRFRFEAAARSHPGLVRDNNEDFVFAGEALIAVADGVGGSVFGEVASEIVIDAIAYLDDAVYQAEPVAEVRAAVDRASERLIQAIEENRVRRGMATTLTALRLDGPSIVVVNVGDSRAYRLRHGELQRLTRDDSLVQDLVDSGAITDAQAMRHPARSVVLQALNGGPVEPHVTVDEAEDGDRYLVCSDGLTDYVEEPVVARTMMEHSDGEECCTALLDAALGVGAPDNVSCVVADVRPL
jgi:serine/threonine protein phosphatase PrpC